MRLTSRYKFFITCAFILSVFSKEALANSVCISPSDTGESIVIFLNGITNEDSDSKSSSLLLEKKLSSTGVCNSDNNCTVDRFWNKTDHGLNDHQELIYVGALEKYAADSALIQLTRKIRSDHTSYKEDLINKAFDTQAFDEIDALMIQQLDNVESTLENDSILGSNEIRRLTVPFDEIGSKVTSWLSSYIQQNEDSIKVTSPYQSLVLSEMINKELDYDILFKKYFLKELSIQYFSHSETYKNEEDRSYAAVAIKETVDEFVLILEEHIKSGKKVVVVAHSQGNHIIELAYASLVQKLGDYVKDSLQVVGVASVASTTPNDSYVTWNADRTVLTAHNLISLSPPLVPNFSSTTDYIEGVSLTGANHSFEKVYMNPNLKGIYTPQPNEDTTELAIYIQNNLEYAIDDIVSGLVDRAIKNSKVRTFNTDFTFSIPEGQDKSTKAMLFDATGSGHIDDPIEVYGWDWGDESTILTSNSPITSHEYAEYGTYEVTLVYTTKCGVSNSIKKEVDVGYSPEKPTNLTAVRNGNSISFTWDDVEGADNYLFYISETLVDDSAWASDDVVIYPATEANITLSALDKNKIYYVEVVARLKEFHSKLSDVLKVELQGVTPEKLSIPATLSREEGKNKFVPFIFTPIELKEKVDHVSCTTNPDIGSLFGTPSKLGVSFIAPAVNDITSFIIKCAAYEEPKELFGGYIEPLVTSNNLVVTVTQTVVINNPPVAKITTDKSLPTLVEGDSFNLKGDTSTDPDTGDSITAYSWVENGSVIGTSAILPLPLPTKSLIAGTRTISLSVTDNGANGGLTNTTDVTFTVKEKPNTLPVARITSETDLTNVFEGDSVTLKADTSTDAEGAIKSYLWEELGQSIGTGSTVSLPNLTLGKHFIKLTVTDSQDALHFHQITIDAKEEVTDITAGLVAHYEFEGNANDSTVNENHGTDKGGVTYVNGVIGRAGKFDGIDDYIEISDNNYLNENSFSISVWSKWSSYEQFPDEIINHHIIFNKEEQYELALFGNLLQGGDGDIAKGKASFALNTNNNWFWKKTGAVISLNNFNHFTLVIVKNNLVKFYINGVLIKEVAYSSSIIKNENALRIGARGAPNQDVAHFNGLIDDFRLYNRVLTNSEITALYQLGNITTATGKLNDTGITQCADNSSNNLACPVSTHPNQDAQSGRDVTHNDDSDGHAGFSFTKISSTGTELPASATEWSCVRDNVTGLTWEVKTDDAGLHDKDNTYTWYNPNPSTNGGDAGYINNNLNTHHFVIATNSVGYCGVSNWRMPNINELFSLSQLGANSLPRIDAQYFPNTSITIPYRSSTPSSHISAGSWNLDINGYPHLHSGSKDATLSVRLVHD